VGADADAEVGMTRMRGGWAVTGLHRTTFGTGVVSIRAGPMQ